MVENIEPISRLLTFTKRRQREVEKLYDKRENLTQIGNNLQELPSLPVHAKLGVMVEHSSAYNHQSVGSVKRMVQTMKQILTKNEENAWLAMLIYRTTDIPGINKSPSELLNGRKYRTNLPVIDFHKKETEREVEKLYEKRENLTQIGNNLQELPSLPVGSRILYEKNPDNSKIKQPEWIKGTVKEKFGKRKYQILTDSDKVVTRSRCHIKGYQIHALVDLAKFQIVSVLNKMVPN